MVRVDRGGDVQLAVAYGLAHRGCRTAVAAKPAEAAGQVLRPAFPYGQVGTTRQWRRSSYDYSLLSTSMQLPLPVIDPLGPEPSAYRLPLGTNTAAYA